MHELMKTRLPSMVFGPSRHRKEHRAEQVDDLCPHRGARGYFIDLSVAKPLHPCTGITINKARILQNCIRLVHTYSSTSGSSWKSEKQEASREIPSLFLSSFGVHTQRKRQSGL